MLVQEDLPHAQSIVTSLQQLRISCPRDAPLHQAPDEKSVPGLRAAHLEQYPDKQPVPATDLDALVRIITAVQPAISYALELPALETSEAVLQALSGLNGAGFSKVEIKSATWAIDPETPLDSLPCVRCLTHLTLNHCLAERVLGVLVRCVPELRELSVYALGPQHWRLGRLHGDTTNRWKLEKLSFHSRQTYEEQTAWLRTGDVPYFPEQSAPMLRGLAGLPDYHGDKQLWVDIGGLSALGCDTVSEEVSEGTCSSQRQRGCVRLSKWVSVLLAG